MYCTVLLCTVLYVLYYIIVLCTSMYLNFFGGECIVEYVLYITSLFYVLYFTLLGDLSITCRGPNSS